MAQQRTAVAYTAWQQQNQRTWGESRHTGSAVSAGNVGTPILLQQFPTGSVALAVEIAWGANLASPPSSWSWYDVTSDVQADSGKHVVIQQGKLDARASAGPAQMSLTLDNRLNKYSRSPFGQNYPNVKRGVPVRCRVIYNEDPANSHVLFQGRAAVFTPQFDTTGGYAVVAMTASGLFRQLQQGNQALLSTLRQYTPALPSLVAYWPMEDQSSATSLAPAGPLGVLPATMVGPVTLHSNSAVVASDSLPVLSNSSIVAWVPSYVSSGATQFGAVVVWPAAANALPDQTIVFRVYMVNSTVGRWDILYGTGGSLKLLGYSATTNSVVYTGTPIAFAVDGQSGQFYLSFTTSGADIALQMSTNYISATSAHYLNDTAPGQTVGTIGQIQIIPNGVSQSITVGHLLVQSIATDIFQNAQPLNAYEGERCYDRVSRLLGLLGFSASAALGDGVNFPQAMGPQRIDTALNLIRECEITDAALVYDGHGDSLTFASHLNLENRTAALTIDARTQLMPTYPPTDDDQQLRNQWTIQQRSGSSAVFTDTTSSQSSTVVGLYADSATANVSLNVAGTRTGGFGVKAIQNLASWLVHRDTPDSYRVPTLHLAFHRNPELLAAFVNNTTLSSFTRMDVSHLADVYPQLPPQTLQFLIVGYTHTINKFTWDVEANVVPFEPYHIGLAAAVSGDLGVDVLRADTAGSTVVAAVGPGATSVQVSSTDIGAWTTDADDVPFTVSVSGVAVTVTAVTGATSPQTFTLDPATVTKTLPAGAAVALWNPPVLAIGGTS